MVGGSESVVNESGKKESIGGSWVWSLEEERDGFILVGFDDGAADSKPSGWGITINPDWLANAERQVSVFDG